ARIASRRRRITLEWCRGILDCFVTINLTPRPSAGRQGLGRFELPHWLDHVGRPTAIERGLGRPLVAGQRLSTEGSEVTRRPPFAARRQSSAATPPQPSRLSGGLL